MGRGGENLAGHLGLSNLRTDRGPYRARADIVGVISPSLASVECYVALAFSTERR